MLENVFGFYETINSFNDTKGDYLQLAKESDWGFLVKAHEKEIYSICNKLIVAKVHRDNNGGYPFSKLDFLSHKLQELIYPDIVPKVFAADFTENEAPFFVVEKVPLDKHHIAYNLWRQKAHQKEGLDYKYDPSFFLLAPHESVEALANEHIRMVNEMKKTYANLLAEKGIAFDHSYVNIAWREENPVALEIHKCNRTYLFNYERCRQYFNEFCEDADKQRAANAILDRILELRTS